MNFIMQQLINQKVNSINEHDFLQLAQKQGYTLSHKQATQILKIVHAQKVDVGNKAQIEQIVQRLKRETDPQVATIVEDLFQQYSHLL